MSQKIDQDHARFKQIVKGRIKSDLRKYISRGDMIGKQGKDKVSIPVHSIDMPRFRYNLKDSGGVGQGEGEVGDSLGGDPQKGDGQGQAGDQPGQHSLEVEFSLEDLAKIIGEELELPNIKPRGTRTIKAPKDKYNAIRHTGPESLRHFKRTYREALKRQITMGTYDKNCPVIVPIKEDKRFRSWKESVIPQTNAVIIYIMDVSGSMGEEQKLMVRIESFWIDTWLRYQYDGIESRYIIHDTKAREVDQDTFYRTKESGGTMISSAYAVAADIVEKEYPVDEWNIYIFQFSDGDNWSREDTNRCFSILTERLLPKINLFGYGQVKSPYGSGQFIHDLEEAYGTKEENLILSNIPDRDAIMDSIRDFLGKGK
ncbi:DUF444 family protein [Myxococcota bacterium]|nr:DUF444 family protein [Myxococcota bacterium]MBU1380292.1 DUF444 family protein [Myxococcota bacterium]MBU1498637.1 DUF444 family protein [Myxococcota bacterium]